MASSAHQQGVTNEERMYLRSRVGLCLILLVMLPFTYTRSSSGAPMFQLYLFLWVVLVAGTVYGYVAARGGARSVARAMTWVLVPDLCVIAGFTFLLHGSEDSFYPVAIFMAISYALVARRRDMGVVGAAISGAYIVGHLLTHELDLGNYVFFTLKALAIPVIGSVVATSVTRQREREEYAVRAVADEANAKEQLESRLAELQAVVRITETIHSSLDLERMGPDVLEILGDVLAIDTCSLFVIDKANSETVFSASMGDVAQHGEMSHGEHVPSEHFSCKSVCDRGDALVLFCAEQEDMERLTHADQLVLSAVANQLVVAVENAHLFGLTKVLAITDELTGLYNYRELQSRLTQEVERATRYENTVSLLMIDADEFKTYNDSWGHIAGDNALAMLGSLMRHAVREVDFAARYGGEEFTIILPETDAAGAFVVAEKIRETVAESIFPDAEGADCCKMTVSVGIATFPTHASDKESLLREADDALYRAKREGKNRVRTPQPLQRTSPQLETTGD